MPGFLAYEFASLFLCNLGGGLGYLLRKMMYAKLFQAMGPGAIIGRGVVFRHPERIRLGRRVAVDDYVLLDASGAGPEGVQLGDEVIVSRNCILQGKTGPVVIGDKADIGANTVITAATGVYLAPSVLIAGNCYIGGSRYGTGRLDVPIMEQGWFSRGPVHIGAGSWLGAGAIVLDGVRIGQGCIVGAGAVVTKDLADYTVATGVPAAAVRRRGEDGTGAGERGRD